MKSLINTKSLFGNVPDIFSRKVRKWQCKRDRENIKFLIIDDKDGHLALCPLCYNFNVLVYEPNDLFISGGKIEIPVFIPNSEKFVYIKQNSLGLLDRARINFKEDYLKVINRNFYEFDNVDKFDYVCACRSLNREENSHIDMNSKINKLKNAVCDGGNLYLEYYVAIDEEDYEKYPKNIYLRRNEILDYFDTNEWTINSNELKVQKDLLTPLNREQRDVIIGYLDVRRKLTTISKERNAKKKRIDFNNNEVTCNHNYIINGVVR